MARTAMNQSSSPEKIQEEITALGVTPPPGRSKKAKIALGILAVIILLVSVPAAIYLVKQRQQIRKEAAECIKKARCPHIIEDLPKCPSGTARYHQVEVHEDDDGRIGGGDCDGSPCSNDLIVDLGNSFLASAIWWRMHDHEENLRYRAFISNNGQQWTEVSKGGVHTSGEDCEESCSKNTRRHHPPGDQGCPDPVPRVPTCDCNQPECKDPTCPEWEARGSYPCALSYDEHIALFPEQRVRYFKLYFYNDDAHAHIWDVVIVSCNQCESAELYDEEWNKIVDYSSLIAGQRIYLATQGSTTHPEGITKARFKINEEASENWCSGEGLTLVDGWCETTNQKGELFYLQYTLPSSGVYELKSEVYNPTLGWF